MKKKIVNVIVKVIGRILLAAGTIISLLVVFFTVLVVFSIEWMFDTWNDLSMDELLYHLTTRLEGTNVDMIQNYLNLCVVPAILFFLVLLIIYVEKVRKRKKYYALMMASIIISILISGKSISEAGDRLGAANYVKSKGQESSFVEDYYVSPADVELTFPEKKQNLIYIFLESMETTYADVAGGGAFKENVIQELTLLAKEYESFSENGDKINGGHALKGSTWTIAGMFSQTSGIPLDISIDGNSMDTQDTFFGRVITLGDILKKEGYSQTLMLGSDATFGGRRLFFTEHGDFNILDYNYALENEWIPEDYNVGWGYEDQKLITFAKNKLLELADKQRPFHLMMLTVDTHFEDGLECDICPDTFGDDQYANVMACSSAQIGEFIRWIQKQDFYDNTTIIICGDHLTMDKDFCENVKDTYDRKVYTAVINSRVEKEINQNRTYSTFDMFPTTLAAMGVKIEGNRLGLGTNLFADRPTISEEIGIENEENELSKHSEFLEKLADIKDEDTRTGK